MNCRLCKEEKPLEESRIIPKYIYTYKWGVTMKLGNASRGKGATVIFIIDRSTKNDRFEAVTKKGV